MPYLLGLVELIHCFKIMYFPTFSYWTEKQILIADDDIQNRSFLWEDFRRLSISESRRLRLLGVDSRILLVGLIRKRVSPLSESNVSFSFLQAISINLNILIIFPFFFLIFHGFNWPKMDVADFTKLLRFLIGDLILNCLARDDLISLEAFL
jgi:hypothetical protein